MRTEAVAAILTRLEADQPIKDFLALHYAGTLPHFFLGLKLRAEAAECPYIAVAAMQERKDAYPAIDRTMQIAIGYGVNEPEVDAEELADRRRVVYRGVTLVSDLGELILDALRDEATRSSEKLIRWTGEATSRSDAGIQHPLYEGEILLTISLKAP